MNKIKAKLPGKNKTKQTNKQTKKSLCISAFNECLKFKLFLVLH